MRFYTFRINGLQAVFAQKKPYYRNRLIIINVFRQMLNLG